MRSLQTSNKLFRQKLGRLKLGLHCQRCIFRAKEARTPMPIFKYFLVVGSALLTLLYISDAYFGNDESGSRFNGSFYETALYAPRFKEVVATDELRFIRDATPADRVREVFAQFVPHEGRRGKRYSSIAAAIQ
jgi:hypothetical protein